MKKVLAVALAVAMVMVLVPTVALAANEELTVDGVGAGSGTYATIREAVDAALNAAEGGIKTITIKAGSYDETVDIIQKEGYDIVLQGESGTVFTGNIRIDGDGKNGSDKLTIKNIAFDKSGAAPIGSVYIIDTDNLTGKQYNYAHNITIEDCTFIGDASQKWFAINAGKSQGNTAFNTTIKNCTFSSLGCPIQARSQTLLVENVTATDVIEGLNLHNSTEITLKNVKIYASDYALRVGESNGKSGSVNLSIENCVLSNSSSLAGPNSGAIVLRVSAHGDINIVSTDILGNVYNASDTVEVKTDGVYWGIGYTITGLEGRLERINDVSTPNGLQKDGESEVKAKANVVYVVVIPRSVDFGTISRTMPDQSRNFTVAVEDALIEDDARIEVRNTTDAMIMKDYDGNGSETLAFTLDQPNGLFEFEQEDLEDGEEFIDSTVSCKPSELKAAGSYKGYMTFTVSYVK